MVTTVQNWLGLMSPMLTVLIFYLSMLWPQLALAQAADTVLANTLVEVEMAQLQLSQDLRVERITREAFDARQRRSLQGQVLHCHMSHFTKLP